MLPILQKCILFLFAGPDRSALRPFLVFCLSSNFRIEVPHHNCVLWLLFQDLNNGVVEVVCLFIWCECSRKILELSVENTTDTKRVRRVSPVEDTTDTIPLKRVSSVEDTTNTGQTSIASKSQNVCNIQRYTPITVSKTAPFQTRKNLIDLVISW